MTLAEVIALINSDIVPNGNNEITANVLRPILIEMLQQPNDLIGELDELNTVENDTLVKAINSVNNALSDVEGLVILSGQGDPNQQSFPSLSIADLYSEIDGVGSPLALWIYDGTKFIRFSDKYLSYEIPQDLTPIEQLTARSNINATDRRLEELAGNLTEEERTKIRQKISAVSIDDTQASDDTTYSSNIIDQKLNLKLDLDLSNLSDDLTASEKGIIQDKLGIEDTDLTGLLTNPTYDSDTHIFTMDVIGGSQFQIDFPIEALITNVDLDNDNNLVITFEDGSVTTVPLNTLLVGVVKSVNGKTPNSQGQVVITAEDIADLPAVPTNYITTNTNQTGLTGNKTSSGVWTLGQIRKAGQNDTQILLAGGGHRPVSDFALAGSLSGYLPLAGGTMTGDINWTNSHGLSFNDTRRLRFTENATILIGNNTGTGSSIVFRPVNDLATNQIIIDGNGQINTANHGNSSQWKQAFYWGDFRDYGLGITTLTPATTLTSTTIDDPNLPNGLYHIASVQNPYFTSSASVLIMRSGATGYTTQKMQLINSGDVVKMYLRHYRVSTSTWSSWREVITYENLDTLATSLGFIKSSALGSYVLQSSLNTQLANYATLAGTQTFTGTNTFTHGLSFNDTRRLRFTENATILIGNNTGTGSSIVFRPVNDLATNQIIIDGNGQINTANHGNSSQWKQAYDWGDFRDYGLGRLFWGNSNSFEDVDANTGTQLRSVGGQLFGIISTHRPIGFISKGVVSTRWSWIGVTDQGPIRIYATNSTAVDNYVELYHSGNFNPAQYVLQSALNTQLANYVPINGVTTINNTKTFTSSPIVPNGTLNGHAVNLGQLNDELDEKANTDGSNTMGGVWEIDNLKNDAVGHYLDTYSLDNGLIGIPPTDALGLADGILLMENASPIAIAENENANWDGYIYRVGQPLAGYPDHAKTGNYLIESKHRFRFYQITAPDSTSGGYGYLSVQPFNAIEHQYFRVTISGVKLLTIDIKPPIFDEITGFQIERNAIGQKCTVAVSGDLTGVTFTNVAGADFTSEWKKGVFTFYWTEEGWMFGGYSPIEP